MKKVFFYASFIIIFGFSKNAFAQQKDALKNESIKNLDGKYGDYKAIALQIWDHAELGYKEVKSSALPAMPFLTGSAV